MAPAMISRVSALSMKCAEMNKPGTCVTELLVLYTWVPVIEYGKEREAS